MVDWVRPSHIPLGRIWREFEGKSKRKYWIQDITEEYKDVVTNYMVYGFMKDEPTCKYSFASTYRQVVEESCRLWRKFLDHNVGLLCLTKDDSGNIQIAGMNCTIVATINDKETEKPKTNILNKIIGTVEFVSNQVCPFDSLKIDSYLSAMGLYVLPEFRREGIGIHLLKSRKALCKALDIKASCTVFTSINSQIVAEKAGFMVLYSISYADLGEKNAKFRHSGIEEHTKDVKFMYILYQ